MLKANLKAMDAVLFLPDHLLEEVFADTGFEASEDMQEFEPAVMYMPQIMRMYPRELTAQY